MSDDLFASPPPAFLPLAPEFRNLAERKTKQINQVMAAQGMLDMGNVIFQLRLFPVPAGAHDDRWRDPADLTTDFATSLTAFVTAARAGNGSVASFADQT